MYVSQYGGRVLVLDQNGALFMAGTDANFVDVLPGFALHDELELLVDRA
ncbi:MAG: hypothetical protein KDK39_13735 [Leptospiraceae bacterium]|nr:hypothetical protein [Leptospiraceae bacterium]